MAEPQVSSLASSGSSAVFLTLCIGSGEADATRAREVCGMVPTLVRSVGRRNPAVELSCVVGLGADAWERLAPGRGRPKQLHVFPTLSDGPRTAPATPGDVFLHVRAQRRDFCHALVRLIIEKLGDSVRIVDETHGFAYMDNRDLIGFVDGTENPEDMLQRMFVADADGVYDRLLDFSRAVTGAHFFAPSLEVLEALADPPTIAESGVAAAVEAAPASNGDLGIGSLRRR